MAEILNDNNFKEETSEGLVLVDFFADWCGPCKMVSPVIDELAEEVDDVKIVKVNVDESPMTATEFKIRSIPAFAVLKNGEVVETAVGANPKGFFIELIEKNK